MKEEYVLYILMRTDLPSMNPGKAMAQSSHASNKFVFDVKNKNVKSLSEEDEFLYGQAKLWQYQTDQGFGTVLVLGSKLKDIEKLMKIGQLPDSNYFCGQVVDPTYPYIIDSEIVGLVDPTVHTINKQMVSDNKSLCFRKEITCAYAFSEKNNPLLKMVIGRLSLHP
ncbi:MAG: peptidyl-tRNA hydrolase [bacterium]